MVHDPNNLCTVGDKILIEEIPRRKWLEMTFFYKSQRFKYEYFECIACVFTTHDLRDVFHKMFNVLYKAK